MRAELAREWRRILVPHWLLLDLDLIGCFAGPASANSRLGKPPCATVAD